MAPFSLIVSEIMIHTSAAFAGWSIGITQDLAEKSAYQRGAHPFHSWEVDTLEVAQKIKRLFTGLGMAESTTRDLSQDKRTHVYILKK